MADEKKATVKLIGEGGSNIELELPLRTVYIEQVNKGSLRPADEKSAEKLAEAGILQGVGTELAPSANVEALRELEAREEALAAKEAALAEREAELAATPDDDSSDESGEAPKGKGA